MDALADELAIRRVLAEYGHLCDAGDFAGVADRFTPDGSFRFGRRVVEGRAGLVAFLEETQTPERRGVHLTTDTVVDLDGDRATAVSSFAFVRFDGGALAPMAAGTYTDELVRVEGRWLIRSRSTRPIKPVAP